MKNWFGVTRGGDYSAVHQSDRVYEPTTEPKTAQSLSPTQTVFNKYLQGRLSSGKSKSKWVYTTTVCGLCAIIIGTIIAAVDPFQILFKMKVVFSDGGETFLLWEKPEVELLLKVYLFNVTNKDEFLKGAKLQVQEVGPYVYRENLAHLNVSFNDNGTVTAIPVHPLTWVPELSNGTEDDILILPNIALLSFAQVMSKSSILTKVGVNMLIKQTDTKPLVPMTAKEFMFGYKSTLLTLGNKLMPSWISFGKLGLIDRMYNFEGDISTTYTGTTDLRLSGLLEKYNRLDHLPQWKFPCNNITGASDGTKFNSLIKKDDELLFFRKSLCRSISLVRIGEEVVKGIHGYRYTFKNNSMDNGFTDPTNKCFCLDRCLPRGILDVHKCYYGFPIALSYPHFYDTDEAVQESVIGMNPQKDLHTTYFVINEDAGLPLQLSVKMQINMAFSDISTIANVKRFSHMILPMLWTDITMAELPTGINTRFYIYLTIGPILQTLTVSLLLICGVAFILLSLASALLIPKINLISSNRGGHGGTNAAGICRNNGDEWTTDIPSAMSKKRQPPSLTSKQNKSKEMELYYCSLLAVQNEEC